MTDPRHPTDPPQTSDALLEAAPGHPEFDDEILVEQYLLGRLDDADTHRFEQHYLDCPSCLERLEVTQALIDSLHQGAAQEALRVAQLGTVAAFWHRLDLSPRVLTGALGILLLAAVGWSGWQQAALGSANDQLRGQLEALRASAESPIQVSLSPLRSGSDVASTRRLTLPSELQWLRLRLDVGLVPGTSCEVSLLQDGEVRWRREGVVADAAGYLDLLLPTDVLPIGEVQWVVEETSSGADGGPDSKVEVGRFAVLVESL